MEVEVQEIEVAVEVRLCGVGESSRGVCDLVGAGEVSRCIEESLLRTCIRGVGPNSEG